MNPRHSMVMDGAIWFFFQPLESKVKLRKWLLHTLVWQDNFIKERQFIINYGNLNSSSDRAVSCAWGNWIEKDFVKMETHIFKASTDNVLCRTCMLLYG